MTKPRSYRRLLYSIFLAVIAVLVAGYFLFRSETPALPELAGNLPDNMDQASVAFDERIKRTFPIPIAADVLKTKLQEEGFLVKPELGFAEFQLPGLVCSKRWQIHWAVENETAVQVQGGYGLICL